MAETKTSKEYFNQLHSAARIVLKTAGTVNISDLNSINIGFNNVKEDLANIAHYINDIAYPIFLTGTYGPKWEWDIQQSGISAQTLQTDPEPPYGTGNYYGPECYWVKDGLQGGRPASIKETLDCIIAMINNQEVLVETQEQDLSDIYEKLLCLENDIKRTVYDVFGCSFILNCTDTPTQKWPLSRHIYEFFAQGIIEGVDIGDIPAFNDPCEPDHQYPELSIKVNPCEDFIWVDGCLLDPIKIGGCLDDGQDTLVGDLQRLRSFVGALCPEDRPNYRNIVIDSEQNLFVNLDCFDWLPPEGADLPLEDMLGMVAHEVCLRTKYAWRTIYLNSDGTGIVQGDNQLVADEKHDTLKIIAGDGITLEGFDPGEGEGGMEELKISVSPIDFPDERHNNLNEAYRYKFNNIIDTPFALGVIALNNDFANDFDWATSCRPKPGGGIQIIDSSQPVEAKLFSITSAEDSNGNTLINPETDTIKDYREPNEAYFSVGDHWATKVWSDFWSGGEGEGSFTPRSSGPWSTHKIVHTEDSVLYMGRIPNLKGNVYDNRYFVPHTAGLLSSTNPQTGSTNSSPEHGVTCREEGAIWISEGTDVIQDACGNDLELDHLYYRMPGDGSIWRLSNCAGTGGNNAGNLQDAYDFDKDGAGKKDGGKIDLDRVGSDPGLGTLWLNPKEDFVDPFVSYWDAGFLKDIYYEPFFASTDTSKSQIEGSANYDKNLADGINSSEVYEDNRYFSVQMRDQCPSDEPELKDCCCDFTNNSQHFLYPVIANPSLGAALPVFSIDQVGPEGGVSILPGDFHPVDYAIFIPKNLAIQLLSPANATGLQTIKTYEEGDCAWYDICNVQGINGLPSMKTASSPSTGKYHEAVTRPGTASFGNQTYRDSLNFKDNFRSEYFSSEGIISNWDSPAISRLNYRKIDPRLFGNVLDRFSNKYDGFNPEKPRKAATTLTESCPPNNDQFCWKATGRAVYKIDWDNHYYADIDVNQTTPLVLIYGPNPFLAHIEGVAGINNFRKWSLATDCCCSYDDLEDGLMYPLFQQNLDGTSLNILVKSHQGLPDTLPNGQEWGNTPLPQNHIGWVREDDLALIDEKSKTFPAGSLHWMKIANPGGGLAIELCFELKADFNYRVAYPTADGVANGVAGIFDNAGGHIWYSISGSTSFPNFSPQDEVWDIKWGCTKIVFSERISDTRSDYPEYYREVPTDPYAVYTPNAEETAEAENTYGEGETNWVAINPSTDEGEGEGEDTKWGTSFDLPQMGGYVFVEPETGLAIADSDTGAGMGVKGAMGEKIAMTFPSLGTFSQGENAEGETVNEFVASSQIDVTSTYLSHLSTLSSSTGRNWFERSVDANDSSNDPYDISWLGNDGSPVYNLPSFARPEGQSSQDTYFGESVRNSILSSGACSDCYSELKLSKRFLERNYQIGFSDEWDLENNEFVSGEGETVGVISRTIQETISPEYLRQSIRKPVIRVPSLESNTPLPIRYADLYMEGGGIFEEPITSMREQNLLNPNTGVVEPVFTESTGLFCKKEIITDIWNNSVLSRNSVYLGDPNSDAYKWRTIFANSLGLNVSTFDSLQDLYGEVAAFIPNTLHEMQQAHGEGEYVVNTWQEVQDGSQGEGEPGNENKLQYENYLNTKIYKVKYPAGSIIWSDGTAASSAPICWLAKQDIEYVVIGKAGNGLSTPADNWKNGELLNPFYYGVYLQRKISIASRSLEKSEEIENGGSNTGGWEVTYPHTGFFWREPFLSGGDYVLEAGPPYVQIQGSCTPGPETNLPYSIYSYLEWVGKPYLPVLGPMLPVIEGENDYWQKCTDPDILNTGTRHLLGSKIADKEDNMDDFKKKIEQVPTHLLFRDSADDSSDFCDNVFPNASNKPGVGTNNDPVLYDEAEEFEISANDVKRSPCGSNGLTSFIVDESNFYVDVTTLLDSNGNSLYTNGSFTFNLQSPYGSSGYPFVVTDEWGTQIEVASSDLYSNDGFPFFLSNGTRIDDHRTDYVLFCSTAPEDSVSLTEGQYRITPNWWQAEFELRESQNSNGISLWNDYPLYTGFLEPVVLANPNNSDLSNNYISQVCFKTGKMVVGFSYRASWEDFSTYSLQECFSEFRISVNVSGRCDQLPGYGTGNSDTDTTETLEYIPNGILPLYPDYSGNAIVYRSNVITQDAVSNTTTHSLAVDSSVDANLDLLSNDLAYDPNGLAGTDIYAVEATSRFVGARKDDTSSPGVHYLNVFTMPLYDSSTSNSNNQYGSSNTDLVTDGDVAGDAWIDESGTAIFARPASNGADGDPVVSYDLVPNFYQDNVGNSSETDNWNPAVLTWFNSNPPDTSIPTIYYLWQSQAEVVSDVYELWQYNNGYGGPSSTYPYQELGYVSTDCLTLLIQPMTAPSCEDIFTTVLGSSIPDTDGFSIEEAGPYIPVVVFDITQSSVWEQENSSDPYNYAVNNAFAYNGSVPGGTDSSFTYEIVSQPTDLNGNSLGTAELYYPSFANVGAPHLRVTFSTGAANHSELTAWAAATGTVGSDLTALSIVIKGTSPEGCEAYSRAIILPKNYDDCTGFGAINYTIDLSATGGNQASWVDNLRPQAGQATVFNESSTNPTDNLTFTISSTSLGDSSAWVDTSNSTTYPSFQYELNSAQSQSVATDTFTITIVDNDNNCTDVSTVTVLLPAVDPCANFSNDNNASYQINYNATATLPLGNLESIISGGTAPYAWTVTSQPSNGTLLVDSTLDDNFVYTPNTDYSGSDSFVLTVIDDNGCSGTFTIDFTIGSDPCAGYEPVEGPTSTFDIDAGGADAPNTQEGSVQLWDWFTLQNYGADFEITVAPTQGVAGIMNSEAGDYLRYEANADASGLDCITVTATTTDGCVATKEFCYQISGTCNLSIDDKSVTYNPDESPDSGLNVFHLDDVISGGTGFGTLTYEVTSNVNGATVVIADTGDSQIAFQYTPDPSFRGVDTIEYKVTDSDDCEATGNVIITVDCECDIYVGADVVDYQEGDKRDVVVNYINSKSQELSKICITLGMTSNGVDLICKPDWSLITNSLKNCLTKNAGWTVTVAEFPVPEDLSPPVNTPYSQQQRMCMFNIVAERLSGKSISASISSCGDNPFENLQKDDILFRFSSALIEPDCNGNTVYYDVVHCQFIDRENNILSSQAMPSGSFFSEGYSGSSNWVYNACSDGTCFENPVVEEPAEPKCDLRIHSNSVNSSYIEWDKTDSLPASNIYEKEYSALNTLINVVFSVYGVNGITVDHEDYVNLSLHRESGNLDWVNESDHEDVTNALAILILAFPCSYGENEGKGFYLTDILNYRAYVETVKDTIADSIANDTLSSLTINLLNPYENGIGYVWAPIDNSSKEIGEFRLISRVYSAHLEQSNGTYVPRPFDTNKLITSPNYKTNGSATQYDLDVSFEWTLINANGQNPAGKPAEVYQLEIHGIRTDKCIPFVNHKKVPCDTINPASLMRKFIFIDDVLSMLVDPTGSTIEDIDFTHLDVGCMIGCSGYTLSVVHDDPSLPAGSFACAERCETSIECRREDFEKIDDTESKRCFQWQSVHLWHSPMYMLCTPWESMNMPGPSTSTREGAIWVGPKVVQSGGSSSSSNYGKGMAVYDKPSYSSRCTVYFREPENGRIHDLTAGGLSSGFQSFKANALDQANGQGRIKPGPFSARASGEDSFKLYALKGIQFVTEDMGNPFPGSENAVGIGLDYGTNYPSKMTPMRAFDFYYDLNTSNSKDGRSSSKEKDCSHKRTAFGSPIMGMHTPDLLSADPTWRNLSLLHIGNKRNSIEMVEHESSVDNSDNFSLNFRRLAATTSTITTSPLTALVGNDGEAVIVFNPDKLPMNSLQDVSKDTPVDGDHLKWSEDHKKWMPSSASVKDVLSLRPTSELPEKDDCDRGTIVFLEGNTNLASGFYLYNGTAWVEWFAF